MLERAHPGEEDRALNLLELEGTMKRMTFTPEGWRAVSARRKTVTRRVTDRPPKVGERLLCVTKFSHSGPMEESPKRAHRAGRFFYMPGSPRTDHHWAGRFLPIEREGLGVVVEVVSVTPSTPGAVDDAEAAREGFVSVDAFRAAWCVLHGGYEPDAPCWRVEFRRVP